MLKRLAIENYRSCTRTSFDPDPHISVLIGPNGSGKTNILQSILLFNKLTQRGDGLRAGRGGNSKVSASFQVGRSTAELKISFDPYRSDISDHMSLSTLQKWTLKSQNGNQIRLDLPLAFPAVIGAEFASSRSRRQYYWNGPLFVRNRQGLGRKTEPEIPLWAARVMAGVAQFCRGIKYYSATQFANPQSCPPSFEVQEGGRMGTITHSTLTRVLYEMYSAEQSPKDGRFERFTNIVGPRGLGLIDRLTFQRIRTSSASYSVRVGGKLEVRKRNRVLIIPRFKIGRLVLSPNQLSEGTFKTLALLFHVITGDSPALLIEEPEVCVHHGLLSSILELIKSHSQHRQVIISTHSDYVLDHVRPESVYAVVNNKKTGTSVQHITKAMSSSELSALRDYLEREGNLGEYWREGGLGDQL